MAAFIMSGTKQAILFVLLFTLMSLFLPPIGILSNAAIALVTLRLGLKQGLIVISTASVGLGLLILALQGNIFIGIGSGLADWLPLMLLALVLGSSISWSVTLQYLFAFLVVAIVLFHLVVGDVASFWQQTARALLQPILSDSMEADSLENLQVRLDQVAIYFTGGIAALLSIHWITALMLARHWQARLYNPGGFQQEWHNIRLHKWSAIFLAVAIAYALLSESLLAADIVLAGLAVALFAGLSLIHYIVKALRLPFFVLVLVYITLLFMTAHIGIILAALGIIDTQAHFRSYLKTPRGDGNS